MNKTPSISFTLRVFIGIASIGITLSFLREASSLVNSLLLAWIIVLSASPLLHGIKRRGGPSWLAFIVTLLAIIVVFVLFVFIIVGGITRLVNEIPNYVTELEDTKMAIEEFISDLGIGPEDVTAALSLVEPSALLGVIGNFLLSLVDAFSDVVLIILVVTFLLIDAFGVEKKLDIGIGAGNEYVRRVAEFGAEIRQYVVITTIVGLVTGLFDTILFIVMGVDFPVLWGILAFLLSYVPTLGFWIAAIPPTFLALLESGPVPALIVFLGIVLINGAAENVVKPRYMGKGLDLSPFVVVFSVIFWSAILGPLGAILSIPMTLIVKDLILEVDDQNRWIATLMSSGEQMGDEEEAEESEVAEAA